MPVTSTARSLPKLSGKLRQGVAYANAVRSRSRPRMPPCPLPTSEPAGPIILSLSQRLAAPSVLGALHSVKRPRFGQARGEDNPQVARLLDQIEANRAIHQWL